MVNKNHCHNCGDKVNPKKRRDAIFCNHKCRMIVANARNHGRAFIARKMRRIETEKMSAQAVEKKIKREWVKWEPPTEGLVSKPRISREDIDAILAELHPDLGD